MNIEIKDLLAIIGELEVLRRHQEIQIATLQKREAQSDEPTIKQDGVTG